LKTSGSNARIKAGNIQNNLTGTETTQ
jgi:hypothetical protein